MISPDEPMGLALRLAAQAIGLSEPNPRVGCVLVNAQGQIIGQGHTQQAGGPHAEVMALRDAAARGQETRGASAYVTLEPCSHHGRTGPCCDALIQAGIARVVASVADPNPQVAGQGFARLRAAGVQVEIGPGAEASRELNIGFFSRMLRGRPWVRMKSATSLDGRTALPNGASQWITGEAARADGHAWRARASAILTGVGTVLEDDPRLDVRHAPVPRQPSVVVVDSRMQTPPSAHLFIADRPVWIYAAAPNDAQSATLEARGAQIRYLPDAQGKVDLAAVLDDLARHEVNEVHVEAGHKLNGSLLRTGQVDELLLYLAPKLLADGPGLATQPFAQGALTQLADAPALRWQTIDRVGEDLRIVARLPAGERFPND